MSSGVELGGVTSLPSFLGPQLGLVSAHLLTFFSRSDGKQNRCIGLVLMLITSYYPIPNPACPVFVTHLRIHYECVKKNLTFPNYVLEMQ